MRIGIGSSIGLVLLFSLLAITGFGYLMSDNNHLRQTNDTLQAEIVRLQAANNQLTHAHQQAITELQQAEREKLHLIDEYRRLEEQRATVAVCPPVDNGPEQSTGGMPANADPLASNRTLLSRILGLDGDENEKLLVTLSFISLTLAGIIFAGISVNVRHGSRRRSSVKR